MNVPEVEQARALHAEGLSLRAIAERLGVSHTKVARLLRTPVTAGPPDIDFMAALRAGDDEPDEPEHEPVALDTEPLPGDTLGRLREMQDRYFARAARFEAAGDFTAAGRAGRDAATLAPVIARLERDAKADASAFTFTLADVEATRNKFLKMRDDVMHRALLCASCGREMRRAEVEADGVDVWTEFKAEVEAKP